MACRFPGQQVRKELRYGLRLPVLLEAPASSGQLVAESENISLHGILLRAGVAIARGSRVRLAVGLKPLVPRAKLSLTAAGRVLRVVPDTSGNFIMAVKCERPFRILRARPAIP